MSGTNPGPLPAIVQSAASSGPAYAVLVLVNWGLSSGLHISMPPDVQAALLVLLSPLFHKFLTPLFT